ncbi:MAG: glycosyltransferase family 4 protein [Spirochaetia bacterium]|nr:glycosyltransferase family 4 protein [Spirochaetia bacterium]
MIVARHLFETSGTARVLTGLVETWVGIKHVDFFLAVPAKIPGEPAVLKHWKKRLIRVPGDLSKPGVWLEHMERECLALFPDRKVLVFYPNLQLPPKPSLPFVSLLHDVLSLHSPDYQLNPWKYFAYKREIRQHLQARAVATVSNYSKEDLIRNFPAFAGKVQVIWNGVSKSFVPEKSKNQKNSWRQKFGDRKYVLYVGDLRRRKNVYRLAEAFTRLPEKLTRDHVFAFTGEGPVRDKIKKLFLRTHLIHSLRDLGKVSEKELPGLYRGASLFVFPSLFEGFGLPILEAQASGIPVVCGQNSSLPEITGNAAIFCNEKKADSIKEAMQSVLENKDLRKKLISGGIANARRFSWSRSAMQYAELFQREWKNLAAISKSGQSR